MILSNFILLGSQCQRILGSLWFQYPNETWDKIKTYSEFCVTMEQKIVDLESIYAEYDGSGFDEFEITIFNYLADTIFD